MRRKFNKLTAIPLAQAVVKRRYQASFGRGQSCLGHQEMFYYDPVQEHFVLLVNGDLLEPLRSKFFPCSRAQARTSLGYLPTVTRQKNVYRFLHYGKLCLVDVYDTFRLRLAIWYYHRNKVVNIRLSSDLSRSLLEVARQPGRAEQLKHLLAR